MQSIQLYLQFLFWVSSESWWHVSKFPRSIFSQISSVFGECSILLQYPRLIAFLLSFIFCFFHSNSSQIEFSFLIKHRDFSFLPWTSFFSTCWTESLSSSENTSANFLSPYLVTPSLLIHSFPSHTGPLPSFKTVIYN